MRLHFNINKATREALVLAALGTIVWLIALKFDAYDALDEILHHNENDQLDEIVLAVIISGMLGLIYAFSRLTELGREIARRERAEQDANWVATHDPLTRSFNRLGLSAKMEQLAADPNTACTILSIDLDGFKGINDLFGHHAGDEALIEVAQRVKALFPKDELFRLGGDEFLLILSETDPAKVQAEVDRILRKLAQPYKVAGSTAEMAASIGIAVYPRDMPDLEAAMRCADLAMYEGKRRGKGQAVWYETKMNAEAVQRSELEACLRMALKSGDIHPYFQPVVDLKTGKLRGFEALARWQTADGTFIPPVEFIPLAEETGMIIELSEQILLKACTEASTWPTDLQLAVNISPMQLADRALGLRIIRILDETGLPPSRLEIEVTESALVKDVAVAESTLAELQSAGIRIALDDFGTGYSSLAQLARFRFDKLKIDRSFVSEFHSNAKNRKIVRAMLGLGEGLGIMTTAEGIETAIQAEALQEIGCDFGQGYYYGKPMPATDLKNLLTENIRKSA